MQQKNNYRTIYSIALVAVLTAVITAQQVALSFLPNIELVTLLIILYTRHFGKKTLLVIYSFAALQGLIYGLSLWFINYLYIWAILYFIVRLLRHHDEPLIWAMVSGGFGLIFGGLCSLIYLFIGGWSAMAAFFIAGIPFDLLHAAGNFVVSIALFKPLDRFFANIKQQYPFF